MAVYTREGLPTAGATADRPAYAEPGFHFFDTTLNKLLTKIGAAGTNTWGDSGDGPVNSNVAAIGSAQNNGAALSTGFTIVTGADGTKAVVLPVAAAGKKCVLKNNTDAVLKVFPASGDAVNGASANAVFNMTNLTQRSFVAFDADNWFVDP